MAKTIVISSGHGKRIRGAKDLLDEVDEARRVTNKVAEDLAALGHAVVKFHDDISTTQGANLRTVVGAHNRHSRHVDISIHFNMATKTSEPRGTEVLYTTQEALAKKVAAAIANASGLKNRGAKKRTNLAFLNKTNRPAILIEVCFVDSTADVRLYRQHFADICSAIARTIAE
jgi:N-acetylmuramoyl-L-alanine amidase